MVTQLRFHLAFRCFQLAWLQRFTLRQIPCLQPSYAHLLLFSVFIFVLTKQDYMGYSNPII